MRYAPDNLLDKQGRFYNFVRAGDEVTSQGGVVLSITPEALTCGCPRTKLTFRCDHTPVKFHNPRSVPLNGRRMP